jgi:hypothetical protein
LRTDDTGRIASAKHNQKERDSQRKGDQSFTDRHFRLERYRPQSLFHVEDLTIGLINGFFEKDNPDLNSYFPFGCHSVHATKKYW